MTGFGAAAGTLKQHFIAETGIYAATNAGRDRAMDADGCVCGSVSVEIRSVNHRFLDIRLESDEPLGALHYELEQLVRKQFNRGRVTVCVRAQQALAATVELDVVRAKAAYESFARLRDELASEQPVPLSVLTSVPSLWKVQGCVAPQLVWTAIQKAFREAARSVQQMRETEGSLLKDDILQGVSLIRKACKMISKHKNDSVQAYRTRLSHMLRSIVNDFDFNESLDGGRLEQEVAILADRCDITEELTRMESHLKQFDSLSNVDEPVGRRLDFLLQEMMREINTVGAKSQNAQISHMVVEVKAQIEKMREQVQNVE